MVLEMGKNEGYFTYSHSRIFTFALTPGVCFQLRATMKNVFRRLTKKFMAEKIYYGETIKDEMIKIIKVSKHINGPTLRRGQMLGE